ncbi:MAG TPA: glycosyltransferase family 4 protein [bacterium]|nr:glycosyltransferase family 4 protein [bacterium]
MNILHVIPYYEPAWGFGGPVIVCSNIVKELARRGYNVTVLTTDALDSKRRIKKLKTTTNNVKVRRLPNLSTYLAKEQNIYLPKGLNKWLKNNICDFELVHIHSFFTLLTVLSVFWCGKKAVPFILHLHESPIPSSLVGRQAIKKTFNFFFGKRILHHAKKIIVVSEKEKDLIVENMPELRKHIVVVNNPVSKINNTITKAQARRKLLISPAVKLILCVGRVSHVKRLDLAINALSYLLKRDHNYRLFIVGASERKEKDRLFYIVRKNKLANQVKFCGLVDNSMVRKYYIRAADILVSLSEYESFGVNVVEALLGKLPVCVSPAITSVAYKVDKAGCGVTVKDPQNHALVANQIDKFIAKKINASAFHLVTKEFEPSTIINKIELLYREVV